MEQKIGLLVEVQVNTFVQISKEISPGKDLEKIKDTQAGPGSKSEL